MNRRRLTEGNRRILAALVGLSALTSLAGTNLVVNGGFEAGADGWRLPSEGHYRVEPAMGRGGSAALVFEAKDVPPFRYPVQEIRGFRPGRAYRLGGWIKIDQLEQTVKDLPHMITFDWASADGRRLGGARAFQVLDNDVSATGGWLKFDGTSRYLDADTASLKMMVLAGRGVVGRMRFDEIFVEELPYEPVGAICSSAYRDAASEGRVRIVVQLRINEAEIPRERLRPTFAFLTASGERRVHAVPALADGRAELEIDVSELAFDTHPIEFELKDADGNSLGARSLAFTREREPRSRAVRIDRHGRCLVDGRPFFPFGMYTKKMDAVELDAYCEAPFNMLVNYTLLDKDQLDLIAGRGLKVLYGIGAYYYNYGSDQARFKSEDEADAFVADIICRHRGHPALLGWYTCDEMPMSFIPALERRYRLCKALDPDHPAWIVLDRPVNVGQYLGCFDVVGSDPYPVGGMGENAHLSLTGEWTELTKAQTLGMKPVWEVPQAMNWGWYRTPDTGQSYRYPTEDELRNMTWQCVAAGANGIVYYCFHTMRRVLSADALRTEWNKVLTVSREFAPFLGVFLSAEAHDALKDAPKGVFVRNWRVGDEEWALAVNGREEPQPVALGLSGAYGSAQLAFGEPLSLVSENRLVGGLRPRGISFMRLKVKEAR